MYILSADGKSMVNPSLITVERNTLGLYSEKKGMKFVLLAMAVGQDDRDLGVALDAYATEEEAIYALERIFAAMETGDTTYRMGEY